MNDATMAELRFGFGENWRNFLARIDEARIAEAERSLEARLGAGTLLRRRLLDVGCGSGLFSLAARRLGSDVVSFDYDPQAVACARALHARYCPGGGDWRIERGSVLDRSYLAGLGTFDVVYAWGVLHHTGAMWEALGNIIPLVRPGGLLFISIYNDQGVRSQLWRRIKKTYNELHPALRPAFAVAVTLPQELYGLAIALLKLRPGAYIARWTRYRERRGMSPLTDIVDWVGGFPFEVARPEAVFRFFRDRSFMLCELTTCGGGIGCNEYIFRRESGEVPGRVREVSGDEPQNSRGLQ